VIVEGQGSLTHPGFSGVTLGLLHGTAPDLMVLCHDAGRHAMKGYESEGLPVRSVKDCVAIYEDAASWRRPPGYPRAKVVAVAVNASMYAANDELAHSKIRDAEHATKLPAADPIHEGYSGADRLAKAIVDASATLKTSP
jgi:uncharacterized NAD-dependent epimerase/dehydratase family protein